MTILLEIEMIKQKLHLFFKAPQIQNIWLLPFKETCPFGYILKNININQGPTSHQMFGTWSLFK